MVSIGILDWITGALKLFRRDRLILFFFATLILDFVFTTVGMSLVGPRWEMNLRYRSLWESGQYLLFAGFWLLIAFGYTLLMYVLARAKVSFQGRPNYRVPLAIANAAIIYAALQKLYLGGILWSITLGCYYFSSIGSCIAFVSSNPGTSLLFQILNTVFPASF